MIARKDKLLHEAVVGAARGRLRSAWEAVGCQGRFTGPEKAPTHALEQLAAAFQLLSWPCVLSLSPFLSLSPCQIEHVCSKNSLQFLLKEHLSLYQLASAKGINY